MKQFLAVLIAHFKKAVPTTGVIPVFIAVAIGGGWGFMLYATPEWLAILVFGILACIQSFYRQQKSSLEERCIDRRQTGLLFGILDKYREVEIKVFEEFTYGGFAFKSVGTDAIKAPLSIAGPLCPRCEGHLAAATSIKYFYKPVISFYCRCGFAINSEKTMAELAKDVQIFVNVPGARE